MLFVLKAEFLSWGATYIFPKFNNTNVLVLKVIAISSYVAGWDDLLKKKKKTEFF